MDTVDKAQWIIALTLKRLEEKTHVVKLQQGDDVRIIVEAAQEDSELVLVDTDGSRHEFFKLDNSYQMWHETIKEQ